MLNQPSEVLRFNRLKRISIRQDVCIYLNRFVYRYRLAKSFTGLVAPGVGKTLEGYNVLAKVFFTYTAYEILLKTNQKYKVVDFSVFEIVDKTLADKIRDIKNMGDYLVKLLKPGPTRDEVVRFFARKNSDIICIAAGLRHAFAHGNLTASPIGLRLKKNRKIISELSERILAQNDILFSAFLKRL